jgi:hypothetical protein
MQRWEASPEARATACSDLLGSAVSVIAVAVELHQRQALGSGIQGDGAGLYAPWRRGPQALQGDEAMAQRSRRYARLCERRLAAPLMLDAYYSGTIVEYYFSKLFIISVLSSFSRLLCVIVRSL